MLGNADLSKLTRDALTSSMKEKIKNAVKCKCELCGNELPIGSLVIHHIKEVNTADGKFDLNAPSNLIVICANCHGLVHNEGTVTEAELRDAIYKRSEIVRAELDIILKDRNLVTSNTIISFDLNKENYYEVTAWVSQQLEGIEKISNYEESIELCNNIIQKYPTIAEPHYHLGYILYKQNIFNESIEEFMLFIQLLNENSLVSNSNVYFDAYNKKLKSLMSDAAYYIGNCYYEKNDLYNAVSSYVLTLKTEQFHITANQKLIDTVIKLNFSENEIAGLKNTIKSSAKYSQLCYYLGSIYYNKRLFDQALEQFELAAKDMPDNPNVLISRANCYYIKGNFDAAIRDYAISYRISSNRLARDGTIATLSSMGLKESDYNIHLIASSDYAGIHRYLGGIFYKKYLLNQAIREYKLVKNYDYNNIESRMYLGNCFYLKGEYQEALSEYQDILIIDPNNAVAHYNIGNTLKLLNRVNDAAREYGEAIRINPQYSDAHYYLGKCLQEAGLKKEATDEYQRAIACGYNKNPNAHYELGLLYEQQGLLDKAKSEYWLATKLKRDFREAMDRLNLLKQK